MWSPRRPKCEDLEFWIWAVLGILDFADFGCWILDFGDFGFWILRFRDRKVWVQNSWRNVGCYIRKRRLCTPTRVGGLIFAYCLKFCLQVRCPCLARQTCFAGQKGRMRLYGLQWNESLSILNSCGPASVAFAMWSPNVVMQVHMESNSFARIWKFLCSCVCVCVWTFSTEVKLVLWCHRPFQVWGCEVTLNYFYSWLQHSYVSRGTGPSLANPVQRSYALEGEAWPDQSCVPAQHCDLHGDQQMFGFFGFLVWQAVVSNLQRNIFCHDFGTWCLSFC